MATLASIGELAFIDTISRLAGREVPRRGVRVGIGDDAAVVATSPATVVSTDTLVERVHFERGWLTPVALGRRAFRVAVSDLAAMGALPRYVLLSLIAPTCLDVSEAVGIVRGLVRDATALSVALIGGNLSRGKTVSLTVTVIGTAEPRVVARSGGRPGQPVLVTGTIGDAAAGVELLAAGRTGGRLVAHYRCPPVRVGFARSLARAKIARAMIDVSDGLVHDLGRLCKASGTGATIDSAIVPLSASLRRGGRRARRPAQSPVEEERQPSAGRRNISRLGLRKDPRWYALYGGEDYELLFTVADEKGVERAAQLGRRHGCPVTRIGTLVACTEPCITDVEGRRIAGGYDHFEEIR